MTVWHVIRPLYRLVSPWVDVHRLLDLSGAGPAVAAGLVRPEERGRPPAANREALGERYQCAGLEKVPDTFVLYRIIGNDLAPRHRVGQSRENVAWILEHEPELPDCEKRWIVNRLVNPQEEAAIIRMLEKAGQPYVHIPFDWDEYRSVGWDIWGVPPKFAPFTRRFRNLPEGQQGRVLMRLYRHKNNYVMNNNGARNAALDDGRQRAKWVLPWDGNCFLAAEAWEAVRASVRARPEYPYHLVPMARVIDNASLLEAGFAPEANEEPQLLFRRDAQESFNPEYFYGRRPKVELLWRLGVPGQWDRWAMEPWDLPVPDYADDAGAWSEAGWVARLFSGRAHLEQGGSRKSQAERLMARVEAIKAMLDLQDAQAFDARQYRERLGLLAGDPAASGDGTDRLDHELARAADNALGRGPYSVVDKTTKPPSGDPNDYWHPAPYYWPHPLRIPGLRYVARSNQRVPGTRLYEPLSDRYDRTRLQRLFDDTYILALAARRFGNPVYAEHAADLVRHWFLNSETAMNPHMTYAQVRRGHNKNRGTPAGIIEMKDVYYFLDGVRLLFRSGALGDVDRSGLESWFGRYLGWLQTSDQGAGERSSTDHHGTYYDLQVGAIAAFLGDWALLRNTLRDSRSRIMAQFATDGRLPEELTCTNTAHCECFTIQGWIHLARLAESVGEDLWSFEGPDGEGLRLGMDWLLTHMGQPWPYPQIDAFDTDRYFPILFAYKEQYGERDAGPPAGLSAMDVKPLFFPDDGIPPFWQYSLR